MRLIDDEWVTQEYYKNPSYANLCKVLNDAPTIDAVPVIRCKDCKHWIPYDWMFSDVWQSKNIDDYPENEIGCEYCDSSMTSNDFCSRGERKDGEHETD